MPTATVNVECTDAQYGFLTDAAKIKAFVGGIGSGKTFAGVLQLLQQPAGSIGAVVAPTYPMLRDATIIAFKQICAPLILSWKESPSISATLRNGTTVLFRSGDEPDRLRGPNLNWFWMDEGAYCDESVFDVMLGRIRVDPRNAWVTSSPNRKNWLYRAFGPGNPYGYSLHTASTRDNYHLPKDYVDSLVTRYSSSFAEQEIEGRFVDFEGARVKREWLRYSGNPSCVRYAMGVDLAVSLKTEADYTAIVVCGEDAAGNVHVVDVYRDKLTFNDILEAIKRYAAKWSVESIAIEKVQAQAYVAQELIRTTMLPIDPVTPNGDKLARFMPVEAKIEHGFVCLANGLASYFEDELLSFPNTDHDDTVDALVYAIHAISNKFQIYSI
jgi:predicted phage terminase large subunit-like protein